MAKPTNRCGRPRLHLVVMVKEPRSGWVKTRLAREIGSVRATAFYRCACKTVIGRLARDPRWSTRLAIAPDTSVPSRSIPVGTLRLGQGTGNLGQRMQHVMDRLPPGPVLIIGTDIPEITATRIAAAFLALRSHDAVFGPADDGGYWCVGLRRTPRIRRIFEGVRWSSRHTLEDTLSNLSDARVGQTAMLVDVDNAVEFSAHAAAASRLTLPLRYRTNL